MTIEKNGKFTRYAKIKRLGRYRLPPTVLPYRRMYQQSLIAHFESLKAFFAENSIF